MEEVRNYINQVRRDFSYKKLDEKEVGDNPIAFFSRWIEEAIDSQILDPYAMCVSTVSQDGMPSSRIVYLRDLAENGFVFYTNYQSQKGKEIAFNPNASLNFYWAEIERQVRIAGRVKKYDAEKSDEYFANRPRESKIGAWASDQSSVLKSREELENKLEDLKGRFEGEEEIPRPPHWGGYILEPEMVEFWQGRPSRLHDRIRFSKNGDEWLIERLSP